jgi:hypothetical protein
MLEKIWLPAPLPAIPGGDEVATSDNHLPFLLGV